MIGILLTASTGFSASYDTERSYFLGGYFSLASYDTRWDVVTKKADSKRAPNAEAATESLKTHGWAIKRYEAKGPIGEIFQLDSQYLVATKIESGKKICVVAFRGTQGKIRDWVGTDFDAKPVTFLNTGTTVHKGFLQYTMPAYKNTELNTMIASIAKEPNSVIIITGHSLGGAAAILYAAMLIENKIPYSKLQVVTFGQPETAKDNFINRYSSKINLTRFVRVGDVVPVSAAVLGYRHFGTKIQALGSINPVAAHDSTEYRNLAIKNSPAYATYYGAK